MVDDKKIIGTSKSPKFKTLGDDLRQQENDFM